MIVSIVIYIITALCGAHTVAYRIIDSAPQMQ